MKQIIFILGAALLISCTTPTSKQNEDSVKDVAQAVLQTSVLTD